jgi:hypothetical protein
MLEHRFFNKLLDVLWEESDLGGTLIVAMNRI